MIINQIDLGDASHPFAAPITGQNLGSVTVEGVDTYYWPRGSIERKQAVSFAIKAWQGIGGQAALSMGALQYLLKQVEELAGNPALQPVYIQWTSTAQAGAVMNVFELHDGWYIIDDFAADYSHSIIAGIVRCSMTVTNVAPAAPRSMALAYAGGALTSNYSGTAVNLISFPVGATILEPSYSRTSAEGVIGSVNAPAASPERFALSTNLANTWKGGVHVYDTINTGTNPVPIAGGTFVHANWVEVFGTDHDFVGDCVITNGLQLLIFQVATTQTCTCYLWNTALAVSNWQQYGKLIYFDNGGQANTLRSYALVRVGPEECAVSTISNTGNGQMSQIALRLQRGRYDVRADFCQLTQASTYAHSLALTAPATLKVLFNSTKVTDVVLGESSPTVATDYGYGAGLINSTTYPFIVGLLYQNQPGSSQPGYPLVTTISVGDTTSLPINAQRSYGFFAIPFGVSGSYSTANLQAEMESATLSGGFVSAADGAASGGNAAKLPNATATGAIAASTAWVPPAGTWYFAARLRVTSAASSTPNVTFGMYNVTTAAFSTNEFTLMAPNQALTTYAWYKSNQFTTLTTNGTDQYQFRVLSTNAAAVTDWWFDEMVLLPVKVTTANTGPQDIWQQFMYDRSVRWVRP